MFLLDRIHMNSKLHYSITLIPLRGYDTYEGFGGLDVLNVILVIDNKEGVFDRLLLNHKLPTAVLRVKTV